MSLSSMMPSSPHMIRGTNCDYFCNITNHTANLCGLLPFFAMFAVVVHFKWLYRFALIAFLNV